MNEAWIEIDENEAGDTALFANDEGLERLAAAVDAARTAGEGRIGSPRCEVATVLRKEAPAPAEARPTPFWAAALGYSILGLVLAILYFGVTGLARAIHSLF